MSSRRVLLTFEPPDGGVAEHVAQLAAGLGARGWEVEVAGPAASPVYGRIEAAGSRVHRLPLIRRYGSPHQDATALRGLVRLIRSGRFDVVHGHAAKAGVLARVAATVCRVPAVYSPHCFAFIGDISAARRVFATGVERMLAPLTAATICVCEDERRQALRAGAGRADRLRVVLNASPACPSDVEPDAALLALRAEGPLAGAVTVLRPQKTLEVFIDAAPDILRRCPDARLVIVGEGPERASLEARMRERGLDTDARFALLPFTPPAARSLRALDIYVLPSSWEALPIGVLEAMSCGVPQVATDVGGTSEALRPDTGVLVAPGDAPALAEAVAGLLRDPARRRAMAAASMRRHAEHFTLDRMLDEVAAVYEAAGRRDALRGA